MPKITRKHQKVLGSNSSNTGQFGSAREGTFVLSDDPDVIQGLSAWENGLLNATMTGENLPAAEEIQGVYYVATRQIAYLMQEGIAEWSAEATYYQNSIVKESGTANIYVSLADDNTGNALSNGTYWQYMSGFSKNNFTASGAPTVNDDITEGYNYGSKWYYNGDIWMCVDPSEGAAVWVDTGVNLGDLGSAAFVNTGTGAGDVPTNSDILGLTLMPVGVPFPVMTHLGAPEPSNAGLAKFIKLTASDAYNSGLLTSESVTGSAPLVVATAAIDYASSPIDGQTVHLLNTENRYLMPHTTPGGVANDQIQGHFHHPHPDMQNFGGIPASGGGSAVTATGSSVLFRTTTGGATTQSAYGTVRVGNHTNVKHQQATFYMRIA